jgi:hypothetical protein
VPAAYDTDVQTLADNATTLFNNIVPVTIAIVGFGILISIVKMVKKK